MQEVEEQALQVGLARCHTAGSQQRASGAEWLAYPERCHEGSTVVLVVLNCNAEELKVGKDMQPPSAKTILEVVLDRLWLTGCA